MHKSSVQKKTCPECLEEFKSALAFSNHVCILRLAIGREIEIKSMAGKNQENMAIKSENNVRSCHICSKSFISTRGLKIHLSSHRDKATASGNSTRKYFNSSVEDAIKSSLPVGSEIVISPVQSSNRNSNKANASENSSPSKILRSSNAALKSVGSEITISKVQPTSQSLISTNYVKNSSSRQRSSSSIESGSKYLSPNKDRSTNHTGKLYFCFKCPQSFSKLQDYRLHYKKHKPSYSEPLSPKADKTLEDNLKTHPNSIDKMYDCSKCSQSFKSVKDYREHYKIHESSDCETHVPQQCAIHRTKKCYGEDKHKLLQSDASSQHKRIKIRILTQQPNPANSCHKTMVVETHTQQSNKGITIQSQTPQHSIVHSKGKKNESKTNAPQPRSAKSRKEKTYVCCQCPESFTTLRDYREHNATHDSVTIYTPTKTKRTLYKCPNCTKTFKKVGSFRRHLCSHLNICAYTCKHCLISFMEKKQLIGHIMQQHRGEKKYMCTVCGQKFYHRMGYMQHKTTHVSDPPYQCSRCSASFPTVAKRVKHLTHHATKCPICRKPFNSNDNLSRHISVVHKGVEDCSFPNDTSEEEDSEMEEKFSDFDELYIESDADTYTSQDSDIETKPTKPQKRYKPQEHHVCFICDHMFPRKKSLDFHMKSHEIYSCPSCPKFFCRNSLLKNHVKEHVEKNASSSLKAFESLQASYQPQPLQIIPDQVQTFLSSSVPVPFVPTNQDLGSNPEISELEVKNCTDFIGWYSSFKDLAKNLKYPIGHDLYQSINQIISELTSTLYSTKLARENRESYVKIHNELMAVITKNGQYLCNNGF